MKFKQPEVKDIPKLTKVKKGHKLLILKLLVITFLVACSAYGVYSFYSTYTFQNPIILRSPIVKREKDVLVSPVSKKGKTSGIFNVGKIADAIYRLESSNGKNDSCKKLGKFNGFGFRQNSFEWICYDSHEQVRQLVINWLTDHIKNGDVESALCMYNEGKAESSCNYAVNYQSIQ